jgi:hypothetical protein
VRRARDYYRSFATFYLRNDHSMVDPETSTSAISTIQGILSVEDANNEHFDVSFKYATYQFSCSEIMRARVFSVFPEFTSRAI